MKDYLQIGERTLTVPKYFSDYIDELQKLIDYCRLIDDDEITSKYDEQIYHAFRFLIHWYKDIYLRCDSYNIELKLYMPIAYIDSHTERLSFEWGRNKRSTRYFIIEFSTTSITAEYFGGSQYPNDFSNRREIEVKGKLIDINRVDFAFMPSLNDFLIFSKTI